MRMKKTIYDIYSNKKTVILLFVLLIICIASVLCNVIQFNLVKESRISNDNLTDYNKELYDKNQTLNENYNNLYQAVLNNNQSEIYKKIGNVCGDILPPLQLASKHMII